jgi:hypothetical protein
VNDLNWRKSTFSNGNGGGCVEVADLPDGGRAVRDTKLGEASPVLWYTKGEWEAFLAGVKDGQFD